MPTATITQNEGAKNATVKLTADYIMKEAIQLYLKNAESEKQLIQSALASREHLRTTGLHITGDEFSTWVQEIQRNAKAPMPACHK